MACLLPYSRAVHGSAIVYAALGVLVSGAATAQIRTDGSLGPPAQSLAGPRFVIPQSLGRVSGSNLFHSFQTFNINTGQSANFTTATPGLANVISRVTGGTLSHINGPLKLTPVSGAPNFFFINPAGVTFGAGASIDVPGAFHVSTANYIRFPDGNFHADVSRASTFSSAAPEAFGYLGTTRAPITVRDGVVLATRPLQPLSVVAGDIQVNNAMVYSPGGEIRVGAVGQQVQEIGFAGPLPALSGNLSIRNGGAILSETVTSAAAAPVRVSAGSISIDGQGGFTGIATMASGGSGDAGAIEVSTAGALSILDGGRIASTMLGSSGSAGSIKVSAGSMLIDGRGGFAAIFNEAAGSNGGAGAIEVSVSGNLSIVDGGEVSSSSLSSGHAGSVRVSADSIRLDGQTAFASIFSRAAEGARNAGAVQVSATGNLSMLNGGRIFSVSSNQSGNAGSVNVSADSIGIDGRQAGQFVTAIYSAALNGSGSAGHVDVSAAGRLSIVNDGHVSSVTFDGSGAAGGVRVRGDAIRIDGQGSFAGIASDTDGFSGNAGTVEVSAARDLSITNAGLISSTTYSSGNAGRVTVSARSIRIDDQVSGALTGILSQASSGSTGSAGDVDVSAAGQLSVGSGGRISSNALSSGNAGSVKVTAGRIRIEGARSAISGATLGGTGHAGRVDVTTSGDLLIVDGGGISSNTSDGSGNAGTVKVSAGSIRIDGRGGLPTGISSEAVSGTGHAGVVEVSATDSISLIRGGRISSTTFSSSGNAGRVAVTAGSIGIDGEGSLTGVLSAAIAAEGNAGVIEVAAGRNLSIANGGQISSSTFRASGNAGSVKVRAGSLRIDGQDGIAGIVSEVTESSGSGGIVDVSAVGHLSVANGIISSRAVSSGNAGSIKVSAGSIRIQGSGTADSAGIFSRAENSEGNAGVVEVSTAGRLAIINGGAISSSVLSAATAGSVKVSADGILIDGQNVGTRISSDSSRSTGDAGLVEVSASRDLSIFQGGNISSSALEGVGSAGLVKVSAGSIRLDGRGAPAGIFSAAVDATGNGGVMDVSATGNLSVLNGAGISSSTERSSGNAGSVKVTARNIAIDGNGVSTGISSEATDGTGNAGSIEIMATGNLSIVKGGSITSSIARSSGDAGTVKVSAGNIDIDGQGGLTGIFSKTADTTGNAGVVSMSAKGNLSLLNGGEISSSAENSSGNAGSVSVSARNIRIDAQGNFAGIFSEIKDGAGDAGVIEVSAAESLVVVSRGLISSSAERSTGKAGSVTVSAGNVNIDGQGAFTGIFSTTADTTGNAGIVAVSARGSLALVNGGEISSTAERSLGNAGSVNVSAGDIRIDAQGNFAGIFSEMKDGVGDAGVIEVAASGHLSLVNRGAISSSVERSSGNAGSVTVSAGSISVDGQGAFTGILSTTADSTGNAGTVAVSARGALSLVNGGEISSTAERSLGNAGSVTVSAGNIRIDGQGNFAGVFSEIKDSAGNAGVIEVSASGDLSIVDAGQISSSSERSSGNAGSVKVSAQDINIDGRGDLTGIFSQAVESSGNAGVIDVFTAGNLSIVNGGEITSSMFGASGNAGSVKVSANTISIAGTREVVAGIFSAAENGGGNAGSVQVSATGNLSITNSGAISSSAVSSGNAGVVTVSAGSIRIDGQGESTGIFSEALDGQGNSGVIEVSAAGELAIFKGGGISSSVFSAGKAGSVKVSAGNIMIDAQNTATHISSESRRSTGDAGFVEVFASGDVSIIRGASISSSIADGRGDAGSVKVGAGDIRIDGQGVVGGIFSAATHTTGSGGVVEVSAAGNLSVLNAGLISSGTEESSGKAGSVVVKAGSIAIDGRGIRAGIVSEASKSSGDAGTVDVSAIGNLSIANAGLVSSSTKNSSGKAGSVFVRAASIAIDGHGSEDTGIASEATQSAGSAGIVDVSAHGHLSIMHGGLISSSTLLGPGSAGSVNVGADTIGIDGRGVRSGIFSEARFGTGDAGVVTVSAAGNLSIVDRGQISSSSFASANAGSVTVRAGTIDIDGRGGDAGISSTSTGSTGRAGIVEVLAAGNLSIVNGGRISSNAELASGNAGSVVVSANNIDIDGKGSSTTGIFSEAVEGVGDAGTVRVLARGKLSISNKGGISSTTFGSGSAGSVNVSADGIKIDGQGSLTGIFSEAIDSSGDAGVLEVLAANDLSIINRGQISSSSFGSVNAGSVTVRAGSIRIDGQGLLTAISSEAIRSRGDAGVVDVSAAGNLAIVNSGEISSSALLSSGNAGSVKVSAETVILDGQTGGYAGIVSESSGSGNAGLVEVSARGELSIVNSARISSSTFDQAGNAGSVFVRAGGIAIDGKDGADTGIFSVTNSGSRDAGVVEVSTPGNLSIVNGGAISSATLSPGRAGDVTVSAGMLAVDGAGSSISASAAAGSSGQTGNVTVSATQAVALSNGATLSIRNDATVSDSSRLVPTTLTVSAPDITLKDAQITAESTGNVAASDIRVSFSNRLFLDPSAITTSANLGDGGSITIQGGKVIVLDNSQITTSVQGLTGDGGDINVTADALFMRTGFIQANTAAENASGGLVNINVQLLVASGSSLFLGGESPFAFSPGVFGFNVIQAAAPTGVSGTVQLTSPVLDVSGSLRELNAQAIDPGGLSRSLCQDTGGSSLAPAGRGGLPPSARGLLRSEAPPQAFERAAPAPVARGAQSARAYARCF